MDKFFKYFAASFLGTIFASITLLTFMFCTILLIGIIASSTSSNKGINKDSVLKIELNREISEKGSGLDLGFDIPDQYDLLSQYNKMGLYEIRNAIEYAATDKHIKGIFLKVRFVKSSWATTTAIRRSLEKFKKSGKFIYAYSDFYTEKAYYLATIADKIFMHPEGITELNGLAFHGVFFKGLMKKVDMKAEIFKVGKFKSAIEPFIREDMSKENREQVKKFIDGVWNDFVEVVSKARNMTREKLNKIADTADFLSGHNAKKIGFVDELKIESEVLDMIFKNLKVENKKLKRVLSLSKVIKIAARKKVKDDLLKKNNIALIFAEGTIVDGKSGDENLGSDTLVKNIRKARYDKKVKAIVIRVNSPGGSALASDVILSEIKLAKKTLPVYISFGGMAASGGYYISAEANKIFSEKNTLTGSIGVFGIFFNTKKLFNDNFGVTFDRVTTNKYSDFGNPNRDFSSHEKMILQNRIENVYKVFTKIVQTGRHFKSFEDVDKIAQGRIWSGVDGKELGLVDEFGGLNLAIEEIAKDFKIKDYKVQVYPKKDKFQMIMSMLDSSLKALAFDTFLVKIFPQLSVIKELKNGAYTIYPQSISID